MNKKLYKGYTATLNGFKDFPQPHVQLSKPGSLWLALDMDYAREVFPEFFTQK